MKNMNIIFGNNYVSMAAFYTNNFKRFFGAYLSAKLHHVHAYSMYV